MRAEVRCLGSPQVHALAADVAAFAKLMDHREHVPTAVTLEAHEIELAVTRIGVRGNLQSEFKEREVRHEELREHEVLLTPRPVHVNGEWMEALKSSCTGESSGCEMPGVRRVVPGTSLGKEAHAEALDNPVGAAGASSFDQVDWAGSPASGQLGGSTRIQRDPETASNVVGTTARNERQFTGRAGKIRGRVDGAVASDDHDPARPRRGPDILELGYVVCFDDIYEVTLRPQKCNRVQQLWSRQGVRYGPVDHDDRLAGRGAPPALGHPLCGHVVMIEEPAGSGIRPATDESAGFPQAKHR